eukprot:scaffold529_cov308-Pinguiococcus_pyrenoidosus.AAC.6
MSVHSPKRRREPLQTLSQQNTRSSRLRRASPLPTIDEQSDAIDEVSVFDLVGRNEALLDPLAEVLVAEYRQRQALSNSVRISQPEKSAMREILQPKKTSGRVTRIQSVLGFSFRRIRSTHQELVFDLTKCKQRDKALKDILIQKWRASQATTEGLKQSHKTNAQLALRVLQLEKTEQTIAELPTIARLNRNSAIVTLPSDSSRTESQGLCSVLEQASCETLNEALSMGSLRLGKRIVNALFRVSSRGYSIVEEICAEEQRQYSKTAVQAYQQWTCLSRHPALCSPCRLSLHRVSRASVLCILNLKHASSLKQRTGPMHAWGRDAAMMAGGLLT